MNYNDKNQKPGQQSQKTPTANTQRPNTGAPTANKGGNLPQDNKTGNFGGGAGTKIPHDQRDKK